MSEQQTEPQAVPEGYQRLVTNSQFLQTLGDVYTRVDGDLFIVGLRLLARHCNYVGLAHGGVITTLCDSALFRSVQSPEMVSLTANLNLSFVSSGKLGEWLEARARAKKLGRQVSFTGCEVFSDGKLVATAEGIFGNISKSRAASKAKGA